MSSSLTLPGLGEDNQKQELIHTGRIVPIYSESKGLTSKWLRGKIKEVLNLISEIPDFLPLEIKEEYNLMDLDTAVREIHFPQNQEMLQKSKIRLSFDELFLIQLNYLKQKIDWQTNQSPIVEFQEGVVKKFVQSLPFQLTFDQKRCAWEILKDLKQPHPMNRLLEGDVGSGKTIVACIAILNVVKAGYSAVLICPTEVLAKQHFERIKKLLKPLGVRVELLVGSTKKSLKEKIHQAISSGEIDLVVGTHSLIQEKISFKNLALAVIDEQHRFGVEQRAAIRRKNQTHLAPHVLLMTATPIPRTLALALYGDLDLSLIREMPPGRQKIITRFVRPQERSKAYDFIRKKIAAGRQCFVICPLIEESDKLGIKAATSEFEKLSKETFPEFRVGMLHGKMKASEKDKIMFKFQKGELDILVSTPVVEVGIDVPNATVMLIEDAERFGLAQLHQFRGRVGRGQHQSYCFLFTESSARTVYARLKAILEAKDGFELAEKDLEIRGPGEIYGLRQHGFPDLKMASLKDLNLIQKAKQAAEKFLSAYNLEDFPQLKQELNRFGVERHLE